MVWIKIPRHERASNRDMQPRCMVGRQGGSGRSVREGNTTVDEVLVLGVKKRGKKAAEYLYGRETIYKPSQIT